MILLVRQRSPELPKIPGRGNGGAAVPPSGPRLGPVCAAEAVAFVPSEEVADATRAEIRVAEDGGLGQDVAQGLHRLRPQRPGVVDAAAVAIEPLPSLDERLLESQRLGDHRSAVCLAFVKSDHRWNVDHDPLVDDLVPVEIIDNLQGFLDCLDVGANQGVVFGEDRDGVAFVFEPLDD